MPNLTAFVTLLALSVYFGTSVQVARARASFGVKAPATIGHPEFERIFRTQMNTLEWLPIFLPSIWLAALYVSDMAAAALGGVWIVGRILYIYGYRQAAEKRGIGFVVQSSAAAVLWMTAVVGVVQAILRA